MKIIKVLIRMIGKFVFLISGMALLWVTLYIHTSGHKSRSWEKTDGIIISSSYFEKKDDEDRWFFYPSVSYSYTAGGKEYVSDKITLLSRAFDTEGQVKNFIRPYPAGKNVTVYYDPQTPQNAVLKTGTEGGILFCMYFWTIIVLGVGILLFFLVPSPVRERKMKELHNRRLAEKLPLTTKRSICLQCKKENPPGINRCTFCGSVDLKEITL
jgi:ribosomal protein L40E